MVTVLIVDDQAVIRQLVSVALAPLSARLLEAETPQQAIELAGTHAPQVIIIDVNLQERGDGLPLCRQLRQMPGLSRTHLVIVSTAAQVEDIERGTEAGADAYITKPFSPAHLLETVSALLR